MLTSYRAYIITQAESPKKKETIANMLLGNPLILELVADVGIR